MNFSTASKANNRILIGVAAPAALPWPPAPPVAAAVGWAVAALAAPSPEPGP